MTHDEIAVEDFVSQGELTGLAKTRGHCVSAALSIPEPAFLHPEINKLMRQLEKQLKEARLDVRTARTLLEPWRELSLTIESDRDWAVALAIYQSQDTFHCFRVPVITKTFVAIDDVFEIRPLLPVVSHEQKCYVLALSQNKVRLFECSPYRIHEIELHGRVPRNLRVFLNARMPDHVLDNRAAAGTSAGGMKGVMFGTSTDRERNDEYLAHFFTEIDKGLRTILASETAPLVLAGVEHEVAMYRRINRYQHLTTREIHGSPDALSPPQLHDAATDILRTTFSYSLEKVMHEFPGHRDARRVVFDPTDILDSASKGRISHLLLREDAGGQSMNLAALQTLSHGGEAYALTESEMPDHADIAAVIRY